MNGHRKSPRLSKLQEARTILSNTLNKNDPKSSKSNERNTKTSKDRVNLIKNLKKISNKSSNKQKDEQITSQMTKKLIKNRRKIPKTRKTKETDKKKTKSKRNLKRKNKLIPRNRVQRRSERISQRLISRRNQTQSSSSSTSSIWSNISSSSNSSISSPSSNQNLPSLNFSPTYVSDTLVSSIMNSSTFIAPDVQTSATTSLILSESCVSYLKTQLKKATIKFDKACRQLSMLDQQMMDLQNSYTNSLENDRKTFKIIYRMQLATYEGAHNAYIQYIDRQVEKIKKLKRLLFNDATTSADLSNPETNEFGMNTTSN